MVQATVRTFPLKQPKNYEAPVPRWTLQCPDTVKRVYTLYVGVQSNAGNTLAGQAEADIDRWLSAGTIKPAAIDAFRVTEGFDRPETRVWVAYWVDDEDFHSQFETLQLAERWRALGSDKHSIGLWCEHFITPVDRLETNYSRLDHKPGLAQLPGVEQPGHNLSAYWGAGRDRLPAAAHDLFEKPEFIPQPTVVPKGIGEHLTGTNYNNMCHIRSGQYWEKCPDDERIAYEENLQQTLMTGMRYLWAHPEETGTIGLRFLQNTNSDGELMKETCGAGFHRNWADLEKWSSRHPSHLAIFNGAIAHAKKFGEGRKLMTWHEVSILKEGEAQFEYVNCAPETGVIRWVPLQSRSLMS
ncbi:hypothetical protein LTR56_012575 [Elasticomyces elasticus]|nr:hypothetical protein LTR22_022878 [Elasticomyces elasticus]KAK3639215.1 hypothetical protein LTR56_012575 [Elasticomyces elasticus]KAK4924908.1 hypothetical protein LTR49_008129 [Elasticomyces elasticus]KAK5746772.1 hypothetical protein LTS12_022622 [Elasticomyces elasticus]